jgi:CYTH domain-containing protein
MNDPVPLEIERVYLLRALPDLPEHARAYRIEQGYLPDPDPAEVPGEGSVVEGRLRKQTDPEGRVKRVHTIKKGEGMVRTELEEELDEAAFAALWPRTEGRRISKTRYKVDEDGLTWEVDAFDALDLVMCEVELPAVETESTLPAWLAPHVVRELTEDARYRNYELALRGLPEGHCT